MRNTFLAILIFSAAACAVILSAMTAHASTLLFEAGPPTLEGLIRITLFLNTEGEDVNAIEGTIALPDSLAGAHIYDGNSVVSVWIEAPHTASRRLVSFSGIMPAGYEGTRGKILELALAPAGAGTSSIVIISARVLRDDGKGTPTALKTVPFEVVAAARASSSRSEAPADRIAPEEFTPIVSRDPSVFGGAYFLAFSTTDKGVGIDHYEVMEAAQASRDPNLNQWRTAASPYLLSDQTLQSDIYVRAVDKEGNFRIVKVVARHPREGAAARGSWYGTGVIIVLVLLIGYLRARMRRRDLPA